MTDKAISKFASILAEADADTPVAWLGSTLEKATVWLTEGGSICLRSGDQVLALTAESLLTLGKVLDILAKPGRLAALDAVLDVSWRATDVEIESGSGGDALGSKVGTPPGVETDAEYRARIMATVDPHDDPWVWQGDGSDDLDSMGEHMRVSIMAGQLRALGAGETYEVKSYNCGTGELQRVGRDSMQVDLDKLKADWLGDPCWDIEDTEGFEAFRSELLEFKATAEREARASAQEAAMRVLLASGMEYLSDGLWGWADSTAVAHVDSGAVEFKGDCSYTPAQLRALADLAEQVTP